MNIILLNIKQPALLAAILFALLSPFNVNADFLSISAGGGAWNESPTGLYHSTTDAPVNVKDDLFWDSETQGYFFATFEHFVPLVPNVKVIYTKMDHAGSGIGNFTFNGFVYDNNFSNEISVETLDLLLYYEVLDNIVSLDLGLNLRQLSIDYNITDTATGITDTANVDSLVPMVYVLVGASPWPELIISGELSFISYDGSSMSDFTAKVGYTTNFFVGFEGGYRIQKLVLDNIDNTDADLTFEGPFVGAYVKF